MLVQYGLCVTLALFSRGNRTKHLSLLARTAESICDGDLVDRQVRGNGNWNLLPTQVSVRLVGGGGGRGHSKVDFSGKAQETA